MATNPFSTVVPKFIVDELLAEYGDVFSGATHRATQLPNGSLVIKNAGDGDEFDSFYSTNALGLRFDGVVFRSLSAFPHELFGVLLPESYNVPLGATPFGVVPGVATSKNALEDDLQSVPVRLHYREPIAKETSRTISEFVLEWIARSNTDATVRAVRMTTEPTQLTEKTIGFSLDVSNGTMLDLVWFVAEAVEYAVLHDETPMSRIDFACSCPFCTA